MRPSMVSLNVPQGYQDDMNMTPLMGGPLRQKHVFSRNSVLPNPQISHSASQRALGLTQASRTPVHPSLPPLNLEQRHFSNSAEARQYITLPYWRPATQSYGVPQTEADRLPYVKKIYDALIDTSDVHDRMTWAADFQRFHPTHGLWATSTRSIEAIAHEVVDKCIAIHTRGITGLLLGRLPSLQQPDHSDRIFTFPERIHLLALFVRHYKFGANQVMESGMTTQFLARIWTTLWDQPEFQQKWRNASPAAQRHLLEVAPYVGMPATPISEEEKARYVAEVEAEGIVLQRQQRAVKHQRRLEDAKVQGLDVMKWPLIDLRGLEGQALNETANKRPRFEDLEPFVPKPEGVGQEESAQEAESLLPAGDLDGLDFSALFNVDSAAQGADADDEHQRDLDRLFEGSPEPFVDDGSWLVEDSAQGQEGGQVGGQVGDQQEQREAPNEMLREE